jgi:nuclease HARBI1
MSSRPWSTRLERVRFDELLEMTDMLMTKDENWSLDDDDDDFIEPPRFGDKALVITMLYYAFMNTSRIESSAITFDRRPTIEDFDEASCQSNLRFRKDYLHQLAHLLWPRLARYLNGDRESIACDNRYRVPFETGMLVLFYRLARPKTYHYEMEIFFGMRKSHLCAVFKTFVNAFYSFAHRFLNNVSIWKDRMPGYAALIVAKNGIAANVWGFIDGTIRAICRPTYHQRLCYSGHKRKHGIKFQSVVAPDGFIVDLFGPIEGSRHDSYMLGQSELLRKLREIMPDDGSQGPVYSLYGDPAYPQSLYLFGGFRNAGPGTPEAQWNTTMSQVRQVVEFGFKDVTQQWSFLDLKRQMKIMQTPVAKLYVVGAFLCNIRNCFYGSQTADYFGTHPMNIVEYLNMVVD